MRKSKTYWQNRYHDLLDAGTKTTKLQLITEYQRVAKNIISDAETLYLEMLDKGEMSLGYLYQQDRYYKLLAKINKQLQLLGAKEIKILDKGMLDIWNKTGALVTGNDQWALTNPELARQVINTVWCADGKSWSDRIWQRKAELQSVLSQDMMDCVLQGKSHEYMVKDLRQRFDVTRRQAEAIARTELNHVQNRAAAQGYLDAGYTHYRFITALDGCTCDECRKLNQQVFAFADAQEGVNFPPIHTNCRSNIIGYRS